MHDRAGVGSYFGLALVALSTLMLQLLLTRVFSVTMAYHSAFMVVSMAMFGLTVGGIVVYLFPARFTPERARIQISWSVSLFAVTTIAGFAIYLRLPGAPGAVQLSFNPSVDRSALWSALQHLGITYLLISIPFVFSGIAVCLALTRFPRQIGRLYAADLCGAALGCVALIVLLRATDGPTAVLAIAAVAATGGALFALDAGSRRTLAAAAAVAVTLWVLTAGHAVMVRQGQGVLKLVWYKGARIAQPLYEKWNSYAYFVVTGHPSMTTQPFGWGFSSRFRPENVSVRQLAVAIDAGAGTVITGFDGDPASVGFLRYDVTNLVHEIRPGGRVFVVGFGGGRDLLSALVYNQEAVVGVEYNEDLVEAVNGRFGDFSGHLDRHPAVSIVTDEARSYISRHPDLYDVIQVSLIDTWAATAAGAFTLTENSLYTREAWVTFLERLVPTGVLSVSRWYNVEQPAEIQRLTALAAAALKDLGVEDPSRHLLLATNLPRPLESGVGVGTILVSPTPLVHEDLQRISDVSSALRYTVLAAPGFARDEVLGRIAAGDDLDAFAADLPYDISPPTDDRPFFFNVLRLRDVLNAERVAGVENDVNFQAVRILGALLLIVLSLLALCVAVPLLLTRRRGELAGTWPLFVFFGGIGFGFMFVEISQMQRLTVFLGHPIYGLSVVLFSLLLASGAGSWFTSSIGDVRTSRRALGLLAVLLTLLAAFGVVTPHVMQALRGASTPIRILAATAILAPLGFTMGTLFPMGMRLAARHAGRVTPWLWGINGATGVCATVISVAIALGAGISASFWTGVACYLVACGAFVFHRRQGTA